MNKEEARKKMIEIISSPNFDLMFRNQKQIEDLALLIQKEGFVHKEQKDNE